MTWTIDELAARTPVRAPEPGTLEAARAVLDLPEMVPVVSRTPDGEPDGEVRGWLTTDRVDDRNGLWRSCARAFDRTGLWPLVTGAFERSPVLAPAAPPEDAATVLAACWWGLTPVLPDGTPLPHPPWPGLAPGRGAPDERGVVLPRDLGAHRAGELLLVPARRPADTLAGLGWYGAVNWSLSGAAIAGVLRSWEERFGAYVVRIGAATLDLVVTRPPATARQLDLLAHEHFAFCPDNFSPQTGLEERLIPHEEYADRLRTASGWHFWWD
jgi:hypothetical protein